VYSEGYNKSFCTEILEDSADLLRIIGIRCVFVGVVWGLKHDEVKRSQGPVGPGVEYTVIDIRENFDYFRLLYRLCDTG